MRLPGISWLSAATSLAASIAPAPHCKVEFGLQDIALEDPGVGRNRRDQENSSTSPPTADIQPASFVFRPE